MPSKNHKNRSKKSQQGPSSRRGKESEDAQFKRYAKMADRTVVRIPCRAVQNFPTAASSTLSIGAVANDMVIGVCQTEVVYQQANGAWAVFGTAFNNYAALAAVFQEYRIIDLQAEVYFSANANATYPSATATPFPMLYVVEDVEDARSVLSAQIALQYASVKVMQLGTSSGPTGGRQHAGIKNPAVFIGNDNTSSLLGTISASQIARSPWLSCGTNAAGGTSAAIPHGYIKLFLDALSNSGTNTGYMTVVVSCIQEYRGVD